jgi:hypothetical protein
MSVSQISCPACNVIINVQTNKAVQMRADFFDVLSKWIITTPHGECMSEKYISEKVGQLVKTEITKSIRERTKLICLKK